MSGDCHGGEHWACVNGPGHTFDWCDCGCHQATRGETPNPA